MKFSVLLGYMFIVLNFPFSSNASSEVQTLASSPHYQLTFFESDYSKIKVNATLILQDNKLEMAPWGHPWLTHGWATFIHNLNVTDVNGKPVSLTPIEKDGWGSWTVGSTNGEPLTLSYEVQFNHHLHNWDSAGGEDSRPSFNNNTLFLVSKALFIYSPKITDATIEIIAPENWTISSPWPLKENSKNVYFAESWISLVNNALVIGKHYQRVINDGNMVIILAIDNALSESVDLFENTFRKQLASYRELFKGTPNTQYLVALREGNEDDGESFENSFNQIITNERVAQRKIVWANTMGHELFHYFNSNNILLGNDKSTLEWFGEGFTEYYTSLSLMRTGLIDEALYFKKLERYFARYYISKKMWPIDTVSLIDAGKDKHKNWLMVYGGGATMALTLDIQIRAASQGSKSLDDVMRLLKQRFGHADQPYTVADLLKAVNDVSANDYGKFFEKYIFGNEFVDIASVLSLAGLELEQFSDEFYITKTEHPSEPQRQIFSGLVKSNIQ